MTNEAIDREVRGFSWRLAALIIGGLMTIEATIIGGAYAIKNELAQNTKDNAKQDVSITELKVEQDRLKERDIRQDGQIDNLRQYIIDAHPLPSPKRFSR